MKKSFLMIVISACLLLTMSTFSMAGCSSGGDSSDGGSTDNGASTSTSEPAESDADKSPQILYEEKCSLCHSLETVDEVPDSSYDEWLDIVKDMQAKTDVISDEDAEEIAQYLADR